MPRRLVSLTGHPLRMRMDLDLQGGWLHLPYAPQATVHMLQCTHSHRFLLVRIREDSSQRTYTR